MLLTTTQAGARLGISVSRVHHLIKAGRLKSQKYGAYNLIEEKDLAAVAVRKPGRPAKKKTTTR